ncbi:hypothetical protein [Pseudomonas sp. RL_15y_Pfl2_60]|uniref:hypothetical protein n=1 Tax=Pseudomonas sp. RL_15y_Pfl2_60 TaxID=3088709 RepID=UPI0030DDAE87
MDTVIQGLMLVMAMLGLYMQYLKSNQEHKDQLNKLLRKLMGSAFRIFAYAVIVTTFMLSFAGIYLFWTGSEPIQRKEVVLLVLHFINVFTYGFLTVSIPVKALKKRHSSDDEADPPEAEPV